MIRRPRRASGLMQRAFRLMRAAPVDGCIVEFGVYKGDGLSAMAWLARRHLTQVPPMLGFDTFAGMPASSVPLPGGLENDWAAGAFGDTDIDSVGRRLEREGVRAQLVKGMFRDLMPLEQYGVTRVRFAHIDADIYEGYRDALRLLTPAVQIGSVLLFDEMIPPTDHRYQGIRLHGGRAVREWESETGFNLHLIRFESTAVLCAVVDEPYLRRHAEVIINLRRDTLMDLCKHYAKTVLRPGGAPSR